MNKHTALLEDMLEKIEWSLDHPGDAKSMLVSIAMMLNNAGIDIESDRELEEDDDDDHFDLEDIADFNDYGPDSI